MSMVKEMTVKEMIASRNPWRATIPSAFLVGVLASSMPAQAVFVRTVDLSATVNEADTCEFDRTFGEIYVVGFNGSTRNTLHVYDLNFNHLRNVTMASPPGYSHPEGGIRDPLSGDFFFPSWNTNVIRRFASNGSFVSSFPTGFRATGLAYDSRNQTIWCAACCLPGQGTVAQFTLGGTLVSSFMMPAGSSPVGLAFDPVSDTLFISENRDDHVDEYTKAGVFVQQFLPPDPYPGNGVGIGYDPGTGNLYCAGQSSNILVYNDPNRPTLTLYGDVHQLPIATGGTQKLTLNAGLAHANRLYWIFGSVTGTTPGINLLGVHIPLQVDAYTNFTIANPNSAVLRNSRSSLNANGTATASFHVPANLLVTSGFTFHHAYVVYDAAGTMYMASNAVPLTLK